MTPAIVIWMRNAPVYESGIVVARCITEYYSDGNESSEVRSSI